MTSLFEGNTYLLTLVACFLSFLAIFLLLYLCQKYVSSHKKQHGRTTTLKTVDGSVIKYDTLRLVYNTSVEEQNDVPTPAKNSDALYVPLDVTDNVDNGVKTISLVQPSPYAQRVGSRAVSECSEGFSEVEDDDPANTVGRERTLSLDDDPVNAVGRERNLSLDDEPANAVGRERNLSLLRDMDCGKISVSLFFNRSSSTFRVNVIQWFNAGSVCLRHAVSPYIKVSVHPGGEIAAGLKENMETNKEDGSGQDGSGQDGSRQVGSGQDGSGQEGSEQKGYTQKSEDVKTFLTKTKGKENPVFDEEFSYGVAKVEDLAGTVLSLSVCDFDKYSRQVVVGCVELKVDDFLEVAEMPEGSGELWFELEEPRDERQVERGEILYSLQYLPSECFIKFTLIKAKELNVTIGETRVAVKASLLVGRKVAKTHKLDCTGTTSEMRNPEFNETCLFEVPTDIIQRAKIRVRVYAYSAMKKRLIGKAPSGMESGTESSRSVVTQWNEMVAQPKATVLYWHKLL